jgi:2-phospho-L-lactate transferase/gluconeogenesis factor (CofD/UPF0052 family)
MTQPGETEGFGVEDHLRVLFDYSPNLELDYVVVNTVPIGEEIRKKYLADGAAQVELGSLVPGALGFLETSDGPHSFRIVCRDVLHQDGLVRHDPDKLARTLLEIYQTERSRSSTPELC